MDNQSVAVGQERQGVPPVALVSPVAPAVASAPDAENNVENVKADAANEVVKAAETGQAADKTAPATAAVRQLKELRSLMPWNWDARIEDHPPGEKAMVDFEDVVNYRYEGRRRGRSLSAIEQVERFEQAEKAKAEREKKRLARLERATKKKGDDNGPSAGGKPTDDDGSKDVGKPVQKATPKSRSEAASRPPKKSSAKKSPRAAKKTIVCGAKGVEGGQALTDLEANKENVPPVTENGVEIAKHIDAVAAVTPASTKGRKNAPRSCTKEQAVTTPGFVLTPAPDAPSSVSVRKRSKGEKIDDSGDGIAPVSKRSKRLTGEKRKPQTKSRRVTFGTNAGTGSQLAPPASSSKVKNATPNRVARAANFPESLTIDLDKYGYGIGVRPPPGCPPLFRTIKDHGRTTVPNVSPMSIFGAMQVPVLPLSDSTGSRMATPFQGKPTLPSREFILTQMVQAGIQAAAELEQIARGKETGLNDVNSRVTPGGCASLPLELSPELTSALATLVDGRTAHL